MRSLAPIAFTCACFLFGCAHRPAGEGSRLAARRPGDTAQLVTVVAQAKYYLSQVPPEMGKAEIYGEAAALDVSGNTNVDGVVLEILEPKEYAVKIYTLRDAFPPHQANHLFALGSLYELRASVPKIGKFNFDQPAIPARKLTPDEAKMKMQASVAPRVDDLEWLVGRWRCMTRERLVPWDGPLGSAGEDALDYFNVYFPYADDHLTLQLTDNPDDRPIAAEFLVRLVVYGSQFEERLTPMEWGPVRISTDQIWVGERFDTIAFRYYRRKGRDGTVLILESKFMRLEFYRIPADVGDIKKSFVHAPIRDYSPAKVSDLKQRYEQMERQHRDKTKTD